MTPKGSVRKMRRMKRGDSNRTTKAKARTIQRRLVR